MSYVRERPPIKEIRLNFTKAAEPDKHDRKMPRQKCNYYEEDCVDSVNRSKGHLLKCKKLPRNIRYLLKIQDQDSGSNNDVQLDKSDVDSILARFFYSAGNS